MRLQDVKHAVMSLTPAQRRSLLVWMVNEGGVDVVLFDQDQSTLKSATGASHNGKAVQVTGEKWDDL